MKIVVLSDTHTLHRQIKDLPDADLLIHAGDIMSSGFEMREVEDFADWYGKLKHSHKILVAGNHDRVFENKHRLEAEKILENHQIIYLNDSGLTIDGIRIWGSPIQPWFCDWAFNRNRGREIKKHWDLIPDNTDILITHGPAYGYGDKLNSHPMEQVGCQDLLEAIQRIKPRYHIYGHIHEGYGIKTNGSTTFINCSILNEHYRLQNQPILIEL